jgi:hypothetical protein
MKLDLKQAITEVWRQALLENANLVTLGSERYPVRISPKSKLRQVDFVFDGTRAASNKTPTPNPVGPNLPAPEKK